MKNTNHKGKWVGGRRLTKDEREYIVHAYLTHGPEYANHLVALHGLAPNYAYKIVHARGLLPSTKEERRREKIRQWHPDATGLCPHQVLEQGGARDAEGGQTDDQPNS